MIFPLDAVSDAILARAPIWKNLDLVWRTRPGAPDRDKNVVVTEFEAPDWLGDILIWETGECEIDVARVSDGRLVTKHYDLATRTDLDSLLDELVALLTDDHIPPSAMVSVFPADPQQPAG